MSYRDDRFYVVPFATFFWGWATWADKWRLFNKTSMPWKEKYGGIKGKLYNEDSVFPSLLPKLNEDVTWDIRWGWVQALNDKRIILPGVNLVSNKGFIDKATYTNVSDSSFGKLGVGEIDIKNLTLDKSDGFWRGYEGLSSNLLCEILRGRGELQYYSS
jgi:hypothetical protein